MLSRLSVRPRASGSLQSLPHDAARILGNGSSGAMSTRQKFHSSARRQEDSEKPENTASQAGQSNPRPNARNRAREAGSQIQSLNIRRVDVASPSPSSTAGRTGPSKNTQQRASAIRNLDDPQGEPSHAPRGASFQGGGQRFSKVQGNRFSGNRRRSNAQESSALASDEAELDYSLNDLEDIMPSDTIRGNNEDLDATGAGDLDAADITADEEPYFEMSRRLIAMPDEMPFDLTAAAARGLSDNMLLWLLKHDAKDRPDLVTRPRTFSKEELLGTGASTLAGTPAQRTQVVEQALRAAAQRPKMEPQTPHVLALRLLNGQLVAFADADEKQAALDWVRRIAEAKARKKARQERTKPAPPQDIEFASLATGETEGAVKGLVGRLVGGTYDASLFAGQGAKNEQVREAIRLLANNPSYGSHQENVDGMAGKLEKVFRRGGL